MLTRWLCIDRQMKRHVQRLMSSASPLSAAPIRLELLLEDGESLFIEAHMWQPFEKDLEKAMVCVNMKLKGKHVSEIEKKN